MKYPFYEFYCGNTYEKVIYRRKYSFWEPQFAWQTEVFSFGYASVCLSNEQTTRVLFTNKSSIKNVSLVVEQVNIFKVLFMINVLDDLPKTSRLKAFVLN